MLFSKGNLAVRRVASQNPTDIGLNCVRLNSDGSTAASNGKVIMAVGPVDESRVHFPDVGPRDNPGVQGKSIPLDLVDKAIKNLPKDKRVTLQNVAMTKARDSRKVELTCTDMLHEQRVAGLPRNEAFPDWRQVIARVRGVEQDATRVCVNRKDLIELLTALEEACPDKGGENPVYIEINPRGTGLVMRCHNRDSNQRAIGALTAYRTGGQWLEKDTWESSVFDEKTPQPISETRALKRLPRKL